MMAGEKKLMHCFAFTVIPEATEADWAAFKKATDALPGKIPGLTKVWYGKLRAPVNIHTVDAATSKKLGASEKDVAGTVNRVRRSYGVCMEMDSLDALAVYSKHPEHDAWVKAYEKVRVAGTTTFDIIGE
ncbi:MAG: hypothetical protein ACRD44_06100 [Bryobacteraceae bacterium]